MQRMRHICTKQNNHPKFDRVMQRGLQLKGETQAAGGSSSQLCMNS